MPYPAAMRRRPRPWIRSALVAALLPCLAARPAAAQPGPEGPAPLVVQRAPGASDCLDAAALADRVTLLTGRRALVAAQDGGGGFAYEVQILHSEDGYTAIVLAGGKSRQIEDPGPTCESLSEALALTLAILAGDAAPAPEPPPPAPEPPPPPSAAFAIPVPVFAPPRAPDPAPVGAPRLLISPSVGISEGLSGSLVPSLVLLNDLHLIGPLSVLAGFTWMPDQQIPLGPGRVEVQLMYGQIAPCLSRWRILDRVRLGACAQLNVGGLRGKASGYAENREVTRPWTSFGLVGLLDVLVIDPFFWSIRIGGFVNAPQEAFSVDGIGVAFEAPPVGVLVATGIGVRIL